MMHGHIFTAPMQPATNFVDDCSGERIRIRLPKRALRRCYGCGKRRRAENLKVQGFYDGIRYWCK